MKGPLIGVGVIVQWHGLILLGRRKGSHGAGEYAAPGGKPKQGESPYDAAIRETEEETALRIYDVTPVPFWRYDEFEDVGQGFVTIFFTAQVNNPLELKTMEPEKCEGWGWWPKAELPKVWIALDQALDHLK